MFNKKRTIVVASLFATFIAFSSVEAKVVKIGVVDLGYIVQNSDKGKKAKKYIEAETKKEQQIIQNKEKGLQALIQDISSKSFLLDKDLKRAKAEEAQNMKKDLERYFQDSKEKIQKKQSKLMEQILKDLRDVINTYGEKEGFTLIVEKASPYYFDSSVEITQKILESYNNKK
ncbi:MAG: OmpH family outer membrane protein [Nitrospinae bacterium]|nr:OmpH family outer membrane protein [Nitrospinota bacterium]